MSEQCDGSLEAVREAFADWRTDGRSWRTPSSLRRQAVGLLERYRIGEVSKALRVNHQRLSLWRRELSNPDKPIAGEPFVDVPAVGLEPPGGVRAPALAVLTLTRRACDGSTISIQGELSAAQWRWALGLLQEAGR